MRQIVGSGRLVSGGDAEGSGGRFVALIGVEDLMKTMDDGDDQLIAYVESPNVTMIAPVSHRLAGIVCVTGDELAHIAIVARELGVPCVVEAELRTPAVELDGSRAWITKDGSIDAELTTEETTQDKRRSSPRQTDQTVKEKHARNQ